MGGSESKPVSEPRQTPPPVWCESWRDFDWSKRIPMLEKARGYKTDIESVPRVNILLVGSVGSGKSSFFNTIDSVFKGKIAKRQEAMEAQGAQASITRKLKILKPGGRREGEVGFTLCDTMGMEQQDGLDMNDLPYVLDGNVPDEYTFNAQTRITPGSNGFIPAPTMAQRMHCIAYIVDGTKVYNAPGEIKEKFSQLRQMASARDIRVMILVTHIDEICEKVSKSVRKAHESAAVKAVVDKVNRLTGIPISFIYLIKNYSYESALDADVDVLNLTALLKMLDFADDILDNFEN